MAITEVQSDESPKEVQIRLWRTRFTPLLVVHFLLNWTFYLIAPILPFFTGELKAEDVTSAAVVVFIVPSFITRLISGFLCDRYREQGIKIIGLMSIGLMILSFVGYTMTQSGEQLLLCRVLHGVAYGMAIPPINGYLFRVIPEKQSLMCHASQSVAGNLGMIIGSTVSLFFARKSWLEAILILGVVLVVMAFVVLFLVPTPTPKETGGSQKKQELHWTVVVKKIFPFAAIMCCVLVYSAGVTTYIQPYTKEMGYVGHDSSYMFCNTSTILLGSLFIVWKGKKLSCGLLTAISFFCFALGIMGLTIESLPMFYVAAVANGIGMSFLSSPIRSRAMQFVPEERRPFASSVFYTIYDCGASISAVAGEIGDRWSYQYVWLFLSPSVVLGVFLAIRYMRKTPPSKYNV
jgi:MFS family permease